MKHFSSANHWAKYFIVFFHVFMNKIHNINEYNDKERWEMCTEGAERSLEN